jgi:hypothetical protein
VLARYGDKYNRINLLLILYPDTVKAEIARQHFDERFKIGTDNLVTEISDSTWLGAISKGCLLACVFNVKSKTEALDFLHNVINQNSLKN